MALPVLRSLSDCSSWDKTVAPYIPQLYDLPQQLLQSWNNPTELQALYIATNPLISAFAFSLFLVPVFLLISEVNKNYSQVDRMWSILPTIYNAHYVTYAHLAGLETGRLDNLVAASTIWSLRLTFNYWRKGGYSIGSEDYRWELLRAKIPPAAFFVFNIVFISLAQSVLLWMVTTPTYVMLLAGKYGSDQTTADQFFSRAIIGLVLIEFLADGQQWTYQNAKALYQKTAKVPPGYKQSDLDRGFVVSGLWSWSRHPNFAAEQAIWVVIYQWGCWASEVLFNWTFVGALSYLILFQGSTWFTELVSAGKYPEYKEYQQRVNKFIPRLSTDAPGDFSDVKSVTGPTKVQTEKKAGAEKGTK
jgi:steroid 5-alpha reductase family enzyme